MNNGTIAMLAVVAIFGAGLFVPKDNPISIQIIDWAFRLMGY